MDAIIYSSRTSSKIYYFLTPSSYGAVMGIHHSQMMTSI